jgi:uncharacterized protein YdaU (DUF1376 family)
MHYFQFNIGDYASHTRHLTLMEDLAYRRMLDAYYLREEPLPDCPIQIARLIGMRDCLPEVEQVLADFFVLTSDGWINERASREILHFRDKSTKASNAGKASAQRRLNGRSTDVQPTNNHKPITINQEPNISPPSPPKGKLVSKPDDVSDQVWNDFLAVRKAKKSPLTQTAMKAIIKEAELAGWTIEDALTKAVTKNWIGFNAEWVKGETNGNRHSKSSTDRRSSLARAIDEGIDFLD